MGYVYFIAALALELVKIGTTARHPDGRLAELQLNAPTILEPLGVIHGDYREERQLHRRFKSLYSHGEWYRVEGDLAEYLRSGIDPWPESVSEVRRLHKEHWARVVAEWYGGRAPRMKGGDKAMVVVCWRAQELARLLDDGKLPEEAAAILGLTPFSMECYGELAKRHRRRAMPDDM